jgi:hypothetical protein
VPRVVSSCPVTLASLAADLSSVTAS